MIQLLGAATSQEGYARATERLNQQMGDIAVYDRTVSVLDMDDDTLDPEFNRAGLHALIGKAPPTQNSKSPLTEEG